MGETPEWGPGPRRRGGALGLGSLVTFIVALIVVAIVVAATPNRGSRYHPAPPQPVQHDAFGCITFSTTSGWAPDLGCQYDGLVARDCSVPQASLAHAVIDADSRTTRVLTTVGAVAGTVDTSGKGTILPSGDLEALSVTCADGTLHPLSETDEQSAGAAR